LGLVLVDVGDDKDRTNCLVTFGGVSNSTWFWLVLIWMLPFPHLNINICYLNTW
jgi:hypothetical protein